MTAFSNGFEFDCWQASWCGQCVKDETGLAEDDVHCPILSLVMLDNTIPSAWNHGTDDLRDRYHCKEFEGANHG